MLLVYKQLVLPFVDYAGFMLITCNKGCRRDLQILQNNALRICLRYRMVDHVTIGKITCRGYFVKSRTTKDFTTIEIDI